MSRKMGINGQSEDGQTAVRTTGTHYASAVYCIGAHMLTRKQKHRNTCQVTHELYNNYDLSVRFGLCATS